MNIEITQPEIEIAAHALDCKIDELKAELADECYDDDKLELLIEYSMKLGEVYAQRDFNKQLEGCVVVPEWISIEDQQPEDGQKCLVVFEVMYSADDANRYMEIDTFNDGHFDSIIEYEDQANTVALPEGSSISKLRAVCWALTELSNKPLTFDQFYVEEARGGK